MQTQHVHQQSDSQGVVVGIPSSGANDEARMSKNKNNLRALGATETVLGLICSLLGTVAVAYINNREDHRCYSVPAYSAYLRYCFNVGEGLWGGVWVIIGGSLGIACGKKTVTSCLVNCHLAFSIVAASFSVAMFAIALAMAFTYEGYSFGVGIEVTVAVLSFVSLVLCIASAALCCCASPINMGSSNCCGSCCDQNQQLSGGNVMYVTTNQAFGQTVPYVVQGVTNSDIPQTIYLQAAPQQQPDQAASKATTNSHVVALNNYPTGAVHAQAKYQEAFNTADTTHLTDVDQPPSYE